MTVSEDGAIAFSGSFDASAIRWSLGGGAPAVFEGHQQNANAVAFAPDGKSLVQRRI